MPTNPERGPTVAQQQTVKPPAQRGETTENIRQMTELADRDVTEAQKRSRPIIDEADEWLAEIEDALDEWAHSDELARDFVAAYQQKGGQ